jgi:hypothetical protein
VTKDEFIAMVTETYWEYAGLLAGLKPAHYHQPETCGEWSLKDVVAHVTWYEREMIGLLAHRALVGSDLWNVSLAERNAAIQAGNRDRPWPEILAESEQVHQALMALLEPLSDEDLNDASRFREMPADWIPWQVIASNTSEHYPDHAADIRKAFPQGEAAFPSPAGGMKGEHNAG